MYHHLYSTGRKGAPSQTQPHLHPTLLSPFNRPWGWMNQAFPIYDPIRYLLASANAEDRTGTSVKFVRGINHYEEETGNYSFICEERSGST